MIKQQLENLLGLGRVEINVPMAGKTYFRLGGKADFYFEARSREDLEKAVGWAENAGITYCVFGLGANLLVGDRGIRGIAIKVANNDFEIIGPYESREVGGVAGSSHYQSFDTAKYLKFDDLDTPEPAPDTLVRVGAGVSLSHLIGLTLKLGLTGLQYFSGIPSTVGGCVYNNVHGGTKLFEQFVDRVVLLNKNGQVEEVPGKEMAFSYDYSRVQKTGEIVVEVYLKLSHGDTARAKVVREEWLKRKLKVQPQINCSGCIFKNLTPQEATRIGAPTVSAGWVLDIGLGMKGTRIGGVAISEKHANFFVNTGTGTAADVLALINLAKKKTKEKFNLDLQEEIQKVGEF